MARVLIVNAPIVAAQASIHRTEMLGIEYLAAAARAAGHIVGVWDPTLGTGRAIANELYAFGPQGGDGRRDEERDEEMEGQLRSHVQQQLRGEAPNVVGISCHYGFSAPAAYAVARAAKRQYPHATTVIGGLFSSVNETLPLRQCAELDFGLIGESDTSFTALLTAVERNAPDLSIDGLVYRTAGEVRCNPKQRYVDDLDTLPLPARDLVPIDAYMRGSTEYQLYGLGFRPALSLLTSRSCPMACSFCNMHLVHGRRWRPRSVDSCMAELAEMHERWGARHVFIVDDFFNLDIDRAKRFCDALIGKSWDLRWNTPNGISVKRVDVELATLMKRAGCANVCVAIESGSERVRHALMNKRTSNQEIEHAVRCFSDAALPVVGFALLGMPGETEADLRESVAFIKRLPLTSVVVSFAVPFRGTKLYRDLQTAGCELPDAAMSIDDYKHPIPFPDAPPPETLHAFRQELLSSFSRLGILAELERRHEATRAG